MTEGQPPKIEYNVEPDAELAERIVSENVQLHEATATLYNLSHPELDHSFERRLLREDLAVIRSHLAVFDTPRALDIGAGTGRLTLQFLKQGWDCLALDNSPAMLEVLQQRSAAIRTSGRLETLNAPADEQLRERIGDRPIHLVAFSSVLHHLPYYLRTLETCLNLLEPGGVLYITHEPLPAECPKPTATMKLVKAADHLLRTPRQVAKTAVRLARGIPRPPRSSLVDYHDKPGLDITAIHRLIEANGGTVTRQVHYKDRKTAFMAWLDTQVLKTPNWRFRLVALKERERE